MIFNSGYLEQGLLDLFYIVFFNPGLYKFIVGGEHHVAAAHGARFETGDESIELRRLYGGIRQYLSAYIEPLVLELVRIDGKPSIKVKQDGEWIDDQIEFGEDGTYVLDSNAECKPGIKIQLSI